MIADYIAIGLIVVCLTVITIIVSKKFPVLASINTRALPKHRQETVRKELMENRLRRKFISLKDTALTQAKPLQEKMRTALKGFYGKLVQLEHEYKLKARQLGLNESDAIKVKVQRLLSDAKTLIEQEDLRAAEQKCIEAISLDPKEEKVYKLLGDVYLHMKDYQHAKEVLHHVLKLHEKDADAHSGLGLIAAQEGNLEEAQREYLESVTLNNQIASHHVNLGETYLALGDMKKAIQSFQEAVRLEPNNPRNLDVLLTVALKSKNVTLAKETLERLRAVNPENEKLAGFQEQIRTMK